MLRRWKKAGLQTAFTCLSMDGTHGNSSNQTPIYVLCSMRSMYHVTANCNRLQWRMRTMASVEHKEFSLVTVDQHQLV